MNKRRPEYLALTGQEGKISSCISDEVGRGKLEKGSHRWLSAADGDTVPSFLVVCLPTPTFFFTFFCGACVFELG